MTGVVYVTESGEGHQSDFDHVFKQVAAENGFALHDVNDVGLMSSPTAPVFYSMFDRSVGQTFRAMAVAAIRAVQGRRTVGLLFRPASCFLPSVKYTVRRLLFGLVSRLPGVAILSIVPFDVYPQAARVATDWIYDPQLWDVGYFTRNAPGADEQALDRQIGDMAAGRRVIVALGGQNRTKGFDYFADLWNASPRLRETCLFVAAGKVAAESRAHADAFVAHGGLLIDARISEETLFFLYDRADAVWSCYAPDYDQSSGIHGRSLQLGVPVIVRAGAFIDTLSRLAAHPSLALPYGDTGSAADMLADWTPKRVSTSGSIAAVQRMKAHSVGVLCRALGLPASR